MIPAETLYRRDPFAPIYTWIDKKTGDNVNIASGLLREACLRYLRKLIVQIPIDHEVASTFLRDNIISKMHLERLRLRYTQEEPEPIIVCHLRKGAHDMIVDGHHRYYLAHTYKHDWIRGWYLDEPGWRMFQISGLKDWTQEQLRDVPVIKFINY